MAGWEITPMTKSKWSTCKDSTPLLVFLRDTASERKLRLFAVACCRRIWDRISDEAGHAAVSRQSVMPMD